MIVRKKPVEVEAHQLTDSTADRIAKWCNGLVIRRSDNGEPAVQIITLEGIMTARNKDYVIKGVNGEFYPCHADIFAKTYEVISE